MSGWIGVDLDGTLAEPEGRRAVAAECPAIRDIQRERARQITTEGYDADHDDAHERNELAVAAACYALYGDAYPDEPPAEWPFGRESWKPKDYRADLVRAAALLVAEIDRIDRKRGLDCDHPHGFCRLSGRE